MNEITNEEMGAISLKLSAMSRKFAKEMQDESGRNVSFAFCLIVDGGTEEKPATATIWSTSMEPNPQTVGLLVSSFSQIKRTGGLNGHH